MKIRNKQYSLLTPAEKKVGAVLNNFESLYKTVDTDDSIYFVKHLLKRRRMKM